MEEIRKAVQNGLEAKGKKWKESKWNGFVQEIVLWLLTEKNEDEDDVVDASLGLLMYGATSEEKLKNIASDDEKFKRQLVEVGIPRAICDMLFEKYVAGKKRAGSGDSDSVPVSKRQKILDRSNPVGVGKLLGLLHETEVNNDVYAFANEVLDSSNRLLLVRDSYPTLYDAVWRKALQKGSLIRGKVTYHPVVITGTSGIGKSFFGIYALFRAVREKDITVVYTMYGEDESIKRFVIAPPADKLASFSKDDPRRLLLNLREEYPGLIAEDKMDESEDERSRSTQSLWWGQIKQHPGSATFLARLLDGTSTWAFVDVQKGVVQESTKRAVILVSDDPDAYSSFVKHKMGVVLYMSIWREEELILALDKTGLNLSEDQVKQRYNMVGGVPRSVFNPQWGQTLEGVRRAIADLEPNSLYKTLVPGSNPRVTSRLVHQVSEPPFFNTPTNESTVFSVYASEYVRTEIYKRFLFEEKFKLRTWLDYTKGLIGGAERGPQFEWFAHVVIGKLKHNLPIKLTELPTKDGKVLEDKHQHTLKKELEPFAQSTVLYDKLENILRLEIGQYVQPLKVNEAAIDAFCLSAGLPWELGRGGGAPVLLLFQMTVAKKHPILGNPIKDIIDHVYKVEGNIFNPKKHEIYLVFIVEEVLSKAEVYLTKDKKKALEPKSLGCLKKVKQVCLQIE